LVFLILKKKRIKVNLFYKNSQFFRKSNIEKTYDFMAFLPYCIFIPLFWAISPMGTLLGIAIAGVHVYWRHQPIKAIKTPVLIQKICKFLYITTPERHQQHHQNYRVAYGDVFTFYDQPAQKWYKILVQVKKKCRTYFH
jgi:hypothetical protein